MNHQPTAKLIERLNSCIQVKSTKLNRRISISEGVYFCLDRELLAEIDQIRVSNYKLELSDRNLANLRHYALQNLPLEFICPTKQKQKSRQLIRSNLALTFATQYSTSQNQPAVTLVRSEIEPAGKISQQVQQQLVRDSQLLKQISQAHYWLVLEILAQLPLQPQTWHSWLVAGCFYSLVAVGCILGWYLIPLSYLLKIVICLGIVLLGSLIFKRLILKQLKSWIIYHLLDGFFATSLFNKQVGIKILYLLISVD